MLTRVIVFLVVIAALTGVLFYSQHRPPEDKVSGFIEAHDVRVGSRVGGRIARVDVDEGAVVKAGDLLLELDPYDLNARLTQAQALLAQRQAEYDRLRNGFRPEEIAQSQARRDQLAAQLDKTVAGPRPQEITEAQALLDQASRERDLAQTTYERTSKSFQVKGVSQEEMDQTVNQLRVAEANETVRDQQLALLKEGSRKEDIEAARAQLAEADQALALMKNGNRKEDIDAAKAAVDSQAAAVTALQKQLEEMKVLAPAAGTVEEVDIRPGDLLAPNAPALSLLESDELWVRAYIPENADIQKGRNVRVTVDSAPGQDFLGQVTFVSRDAEFTPENVQTIEKRSKQVFRIRVALTGPGTEKLRAGMWADVWLKPK